MIQLQFRDKYGQETLVTFDTNGLVTVYNQGSMGRFSKDSPISTMYQRMLLDARPVGENLFQVVGAW